MPLNFVFITLGYGKMCTLELSHSAWVCIVHVSAIKIITVFYLVFIDELDCDVRAVAINHQTIECLAGCNTVNGVNISTSLPSVIRQPCETNSNIFPQRTPCKYDFIIIPQ